MLKTKASFTSPYWMSTMLKRPAIGLFLATLFLAGCESMSESQCKVADWGRVGFADGARGVNENRLADYTEDCGKIGVRPNAQAYRQGWDAGIKRFCTSESAWREGLAGHGSAAQVCMGQPGYQNFVRYLDAGMQVYRTQEKINQNTAEINRLEKKLEVSNSDDERRHIRRTLQDIDHEQYRLRGIMGRQQQMAP
jgi:hypothetical protein